MCLGNRLNTDTDNTFDQISNNPLHSQSMTKVQLGQVFSCWSNVSRLRFDQHVSQLTNFGQ